MRTNWKKALYFAAQEAYKSEVVDTLMEDFCIGEGGFYASKEDWIEQKVEGWIQESQARDGDNVPSGDVWMTPEKYVGL